MKKIMTVSLMAMMVVGAARADIASVGYVEDKLATKANVVLSSFLFSGNSFL